MKIIYERRKLNLKLYQLIGHKNLNKMINHRAQVPGYCGYIPGKNSQNKYGKTFGEISRDTLPERPQSFLTTNHANNTFIQQQHTQDRFWGDSGRISVFESPNKKDVNNTQRVPQKKFVPQKMTDLTYEQAINRNVKL